MLVPQCIGTPYGFMDKTNKLAIVHYLTTGVADTSLLSAAVVEMFFIEDGNTHFHTLKNLLWTFKNMNIKALHQLSHNADVIFLWTCMWKTPSKDKRGYVMATVW